MSDSQSLKTIGGIVAVVGILALLVGVAMPATSTHTSETCVDDPTGFGQECVSGSVSTPNPLRGPMMGIGFFALIGGIGIILFGGSDGQQQNVNPSSQTTSDGDFAEKIRERQEQQGNSDNQTPTEEGVSADQPQSFETANVGNASESGGPLTSILTQNPLYGYGLMMLIGGICGYIMLFSLTYVMNFVLSFWMGTIAGFFAAYHTYNSRYTIVQAVEIPLAFFGAWHGTGLLYQVLGPLPRGIIGMLLLGLGAYVGAGIGISIWRFVGRHIIQTVLSNPTK